MSLENSPFEHNLHLFSRFSLSDIEGIRQADCSSNEIFRTKRNELNYKHRGHLIHSYEGALEEAQQQVEEVLKNNLTSVVVFGLGFGYYFDALQGWLARSLKHTLIFIENDWGALRFFLEQERAELLLNHPRVFVLAFPEQTRDLAACVRLCQSATPELIHVALDWKYLVRFI